MLYNAKRKIKEAQLMPMVGRANGHVTLDLALGNKRSGVPHTPFVVKHLVYIEVPMNLSSCVWLAWASFQCDMGCTLSLQKQQQLICK